MFEKLVAYISERIDRLLPWVELTDTDAGIVLRFGKYSRSVGPGLNLKWPIIEQVLTETIVITTLPLRSQTLTTKDGKSVVVSSIVKYAIKDVKPYLLEIWDAVDVLGDTTMGARLLQKLTLKTLTGLNNKYLKKYAQK